MKAPLALVKLMAFFGSLVGHVIYGLGSKAAETPYFKNPLAALADIHSIDCSGFVRLAVYRATTGLVKLPDGSQNQRAWAEQNLRKVSYRDAATYMTPHRAFICFIKPNENGCGDVGHVWLLVSRNGQPMTLESHGGQGVDSRPWDTAVLLREVYSCYELPSVG